MRIKLIKDNRLGKAGSVIEVSKNVAFGLIDSGNGVISKDMVVQDYKTKALDEEQANGNPTKLRPYYKR